MAEYICREAVLKHLNECKEDPLFDEDMARICFAIGIFIENMNAADVQPVKHGWWTYPYKDKDINQCSECRSCVQDKISNVREMFAYCPFCGARMDGDENE